MASHLRRPEREERTHALHRLAMLNPEDAFELAMPLLEDTEAGVRAACCRCLGTIRDTRCIQPLLLMLASDSAEAAQAGVLVGLEEYHSDEIGESLLGLAEKPNLSDLALPILYRQLWKYPSERTIASLHLALASSTSRQCRESIEGSVRFLTRLGS